MKKILDFSNKLLPFIAILGVIVFFLSSEPFLKLPYDPWFHLSFIRRIFEEGFVNYVMWPGNTVAYPAYWHLAWANVFKTLGIDDTFTWASIIHKFQSIFAFFSVGLFSYIALKILLKNLNRTAVINLSIISAVLWTIGFGTFSVYYQLSWINWYSLTPQGITIPLFWIGAGLLLKIFYEKSGGAKIILYSVLLILIGAVIILAHPSELVYLLVFFVVLFIFNFVKLYRAMGIKVVIIPLVFTAIGIAIGYYAIERYGSGDFFAELNTAISSATDSTVVPVDRVGSVISELIILSLIIAGVIFAYKLVTLFIKDLKDKFLDQPYIDYNIFGAMFFASILFLVVPLIPFIYEILGEFASIDIIWRFNFAMPWFVILPVFIYMILRSQAIELNLESLKNYLLAGVIILGVFIYSRGLNGLVYKNLYSLAAMTNDTYKVQYSAEQLQQISDEVDKEEYANDKVILSVRPDLGYIIAAVNGNYVLQSRYEKLSLESTQVKRFIQGENLVFGSKTLKLQSIELNIPVADDIEEHFGIE